MQQSRAGGMVEIAFLMALCFFLPLYEAPKNIAWAGYALVWIWNRARARDFGGAWDAWDTLIAAWIVSPFLSAAFAGLHGGEWRGSLDVLRYGVVLWMLKRSRFTDGELQVLLGTLASSALVGLGMAVWQVWSGSHERLELNSVGHVNHTAIYLAIVLGLCASWVFAGRQILVAAAATAFIYAGLLGTASRGAVGAGVLALCVLAAAWWRRSRWPALAVAALMATTLLGAIFGSASVFEKQKQLSGDVLNYRGHAWDIALSAWRAHPWFGVGVDNFSLLTRGEQEPYRTLFTHAHSLYFNTLAERGLAGAVPLLVVLVAALVALARRRPSSGDSAQDCLLWGAALSAWLVTVVAGGVNTTLHHEHGLLMALLLGLWFGRRHGVGARL